MKIGLIGAGNMGRALFVGMLKKEIIPVTDAYVYDTDANRMQQLQQDFGATPTRSTMELASTVDIILLAVKPNVCGDVLNSCGSALDGKAIVSVVAGWDAPRLATCAGNSRILRVMPNTPCLVGEGMVALDMGHTLRDEEFTFAKKMFSAVGQVEEVPSCLMDAVTGVSGSGPAYVYIFIEAMADAGVREGLPRDTAYRLAAQTVLGAGKMVMVTGTHPGSLKDAVCSPGGTTIEAVIALERAGMRAAVMDAVEVCVSKVREMSK